MICHHFLEHAIRQSQENIDGQELYETHHLLVYADDVKQFVG